MEVINDEDDLVDVNSDDAITSDIEKPEAEPEPVNAPDVIVEPDTAVIEPDTTVEPEPVVEPSPEIGQGFVPVTAEAPVKSNSEMLRAKLQKSLDDLEEIKAGMKSTFTTTDTLATTIQSLKGMLDALKKDDLIANWNKQ